MLCTERLLFFHHELHTCVDGFLLYDCWNNSLLLNVWCCVRNVYCSSFMNYIRVSMDSFSTIVRRTLFFWMLGVGSGLLIEWGGWGTDPRGPCDILMLLNGPRTSQYDWHNICSQKFQYYYVVHRLERTILSVSCLEVPLLLRFWLVGFDLSMFYKKNHWSQQLALHSSWPSRPTLLWCTCLLLSFGYHVQLETSVLVFVFVLLSFGQYVWTL